MDRRGPSVDVVAMVRARRKAALEQAGEVVLAESNRRVPVDTRELRDSGRAVVVYDRVYVSYVDPKAVIVHEDMTADHGDREAKFLESAITDRGVQARVLQAVQRQMRLT